MGNWRCIDDFQLVNNHFHFLLIAIIFIVILWNIFFENISAMACDTVRTVKTNYPFPVSSIVWYVDTPYLIHFKIYYTYQDKMTTLYVVTSYYFGWLARNWQLYVSYCSFLLEANLNVIVFGIVYVLAGCLSLFGHYCLIIGMWRLLQTANYGEYSSAAWLHGYKTV